MAANNEVRQQLIADLRQRLEGLESSFRSSAGGSEDFLPTGLDPLNPLLPGGGFRGGSLVEWLADGEGAGACLLAFLAVRPWLSDGQTCVVIDEKQEFYPAFVAGLGIDLAQLLIVNPGPKDTWWALEQALRCRGVAVTVGNLGQAPHRILRRLRLAAETGGGVGMLLRSAEVRGQPTWSHLRLLATTVPLPPAVFGTAQRMPNATEEPASRRARIEVLYCQGGKSGGVVEVDIDEETADVRVASPVVPARDARQAT
jgi:protein ImuA